MRQIDLETVHKIPYPRLLAYGVDLEKSHRHARKMLAGARALIAGVSRPSQAYELSAQTLQQAIERLQRDGRRAAKAADRVYRPWAPFVRKTKHTPVENLAALADYLEINLK